MFETGVPKPNKGNINYPFRDLKIDESVLFLCPKDKKVLARKAAYRCANYHKWKIVVRTLPEGVRVWRIS
jgi:hypothetical protein